MSQKRINVRFHGPFSWGVANNPPSIFNDPIGKERGVYLWTINTPKGELIYYVGQTGVNFFHRMLVHFREHMSGSYHLNDPEPFSRGRRICLWPGRYDPDDKRPLSEFVTRLQELAPVIIELTKLYRFFLAPVHEVTRIRNRVESAIAKHLCSQKGIVGDFQERGIRYVKRQKDESPIKLSLSCTEKLIGLPSSLEA